MRIIIVGGGKAVHFLTKSFLSKGYEVIIVHGDRVFCEEMHKKHKVQAIWGEGTEPAILEETKAVEEDIILALSYKDSDNLIVCQLAKKMFQIQKSFAMVQDPKNIEIFKMLGVEAVLNTARLIETLVAERDVLSDFIKMTAIERGKVSMLELEIQEDSPVVGRSLSEINLVEDAVIGCIIRSQNAVIPRGDTRLYVGDRVIVLTLPHVHHDVMQSICGKS